MDERLRKGYEDITNRMPSETDIPSNGQKENVRTIQGTISELVINVKREPKTPLRWYERLALIGGYLALAYGGAAALRSFVCNSVEETIVPTKAYKFIIERENNAFNIFSRDHVHYEISRNFNKESLDNKEFLEITNGDVKKTIADMDGDKHADVVIVEGGGPRIELMRDGSDNSHDKEFAEADELLKKMRDEYADVVDELREKASFGR